MRDINIRTLKISSENNIEVIKKVIASSLIIEKKIVITDKFLEKNISKELMALSRFAPQIDVKVLVF